MLPPTSIDLLRCSEADLKFYLYGEWNVTEKIDITRATSAGPDVVAAIEDMFLYHPWDAEKVAKGEQVRKVLIYAVQVILEQVPPSPDRSAAIRKIREARMDCNSAITHDGKY